MTDHEYVLGTNDQEVDRLALQHRVWQADVRETWRRAGFGAGQHIADLGCGPGFATLDLAELVGRSGRVTAVDASRRFLNVLASAAASRGVAHVDLVHQDLDDPIRTASPFDGVWARWVFAFVKNPRQLIERLAQHVKPGGTIAMHEYFDYGAWQAVPPDDTLSSFVDTIITRWRESGGEPDVGLMLPRWLEDAGFRILHLQALVEIVDSAHPKWEWLHAFVDSGSRRLESLGDMSAEDGDGLRARAQSWSSEMPAMRVVTPAVAAIVAVRR